MSTVRTHIPLVCMQNPHSQAAIDELEGISSELTFRKKMNGIAHLCEVILTDPETSVRKAKHTKSNDVSELHLVMQYCEDDGEQAHVRI